MDWELVGLSAFDEPVSMLDISIRIVILNLLRDPQYQAACWLAAKQKQGFSNSIRTFSGTGETRFLADLRYSDFKR